MSNPDRTAESSLPILVIPVLVAGVAGTIVNAIAAAIVIAPASIRLALVRGRNAVAIAVVGLLPLIFLFVQQPISTVLGLVVLTIVPSLLAKLVFSVRSPWSIVLLLNAVYALVALVVYAITAGQMRRS